MSTETRPPLAKRRVALVLVLVVLVAALAAWLVKRDFDGPRAFAGQVQRAGSNEIEGGTPLTVNVPWGRLDLSVTRARDEIDSPGGGDDLRAPEDGHFYGVRLAVTTEGLLPLPVAAQGALLEPDVALVVDGRSYDLPELTAGIIRGGTVALLEPAFWVPVVGKDRGVALAVTYDGVTQTVDARSGRRDEGRAAALYTTDNKAQQAERSCGTEKWTTGYGRFEGRAPGCTVKAINRYPYVAGLGWAREGRDWTVLVVDVDPPSFFGYEQPGGGVRQDYGLDGEPRTDADLGTVRAASVGKLNASASALTIRDVDDPDQVVLSTTASRPDGFVTIQSRFLGNGRNDGVRGAPVNPEVSVTWEVALS